MFSNFSLNTNFQAYVKRTEKPTEELFSWEMSLGIYMEPETPAFLVNVQTLQMATTLLSKPSVLGKLPLMGWVQAGAGGPNLFSGGLNFMVKATLELSDEAN